MNNLLSKTKNAINENLKNQWFKKTFIFCWNLIKHNIYIWFFFVITIATLRIII